MSFTSEDHKFMALAIDLAKNGKYTVSPNPSVGCVVVKDQTLIAQGWHKKAGTGHAEVNAFAQLTPEQSKGATAYVTLEPCSHYGRTPPCAKLLQDSGVSRVVIAMQDPNPSVAGRGITMLEQAGIQVDVGILEAEARALNLGFLSRMEQKKPYVQVKLASSLDGKTALSNGESKWITAEAARADVQTYRAEACAILSTASTVLADDAALNVRAEQLNFEYPLDETNKDIRQPIKIILDSKNELTSEHVNTLRLFANNAKVILIRQSKTNAFSDIENVEEALINYDNGFDLNELLAFLAGIEINLLWVEAGGRLAASFVENELFDELICYIAPKIMGQGAQDMLPIGPIQAMSQVTELTLDSVSQLGSDLKLVYKKQDNK